MSGHTTGPWRVLPEEVGRSYIRVRGTALGGRYKIANVLASVDDDRWRVPDQYIDEVRANAHLIAAAPELLKALKVVTAAVAGARPLDPDEWQAALDAIAKAEGK